MPDNTVQNIDEQNKKIDKLLQARQDGILNYCQATRDLAEMGVKFLDANAISQPRSIKDDLEFTWEVDYNDGKTLKQFEIDDKNNIIQNNFKHIEQEKLKAVSFISNFVWSTENKLSLIHI